MTYVWLPEARYPCDEVCYLDGRVIGWTDYETQPDNLRGDGALPERRALSDGATIYPPDWYGWQVGPVDHPVAAGVAVDAAAARECVERVATACGYLGHDGDNRVWRAP